MNKLQEITFISEASSSHQRPLFKVLNHFIASLTFLGPLLHYVAHHIRVLISRAPPLLHSPSYILAFPLTSGSPSKAETN